MLIYVKKSLFVIVLLIFMVGLVGCGGGSSTESKNTPVEDQPTDSTYEQTIFNGPFGVTVDLNNLDETELLYECIQDHMQFNREILALAVDQSIEANSDNEFGWVWEDFGDALLEDYNVISWLIGCEETFPRMFDEFYTVGLADTIDNCSLVSNYSSSATDRNCNNSLDVLERKILASADRIKALDEFFEELGEELNLDS